MWRVGGVLGGPQLVREASCGGVRACLARVDERGKESAQQARAAVTTLTHKSATGNTPPLASPETVQYCLQQYRDRSFPSFIVQLFRVKKPIAERRLTSGGHLTFGRFASFTLDYA